MVNGSLAVALAAGPAIASGGSESQPRLVQDLRIRRQAAGAGCHQLVAQRLKVVNKKG